MKALTTIAIACLLAGCATDPELAMQLAERRAEYVDQYRLDEHACHAVGGNIHIHNPRSRLKDGEPPPTGTSYWCVKN